MKNINLSLESGSYDIYIEQNIFEKACFYIDKVYKKKNVFVVTDSNVYALYGKKIQEILSEKYNTKIVYFQAGEEHKSIKTYAEVSEELLSKGLQRGDLLIAFGGGVVGDVCGFIASSLYRGVPFINIPTTLLSQIDSSIGGKTAIDFAGRKNILGAFYQPKMVLIDINFLSTLTNEHYVNGLGELIKHSFIGDEDLYNKLVASQKVTSDIIYDSLLVKKSFVVDDEFDTGKRMCLNFGHTFGHIIELERNLLHGQAVSLGMIMATNFAIDLGLCDKEIKDKMISLLSKAGLPTEEIDYHKYLDKVFLDKKNISGTLTFIFVSKIGSVITRTFTKQTIKEFY